MENSLDCVDDKSIGRKSTLSGHENVHTLILRRADSFAGIRPLRIIDVLAPFTSLKELQIVLAEKLWEPGNTGHLRILPLETLGDHSFLDAVMKFPSGPGSIRAVFDQGPREQLDRVREHSGSSKVPSL